MRSTYVQQLHDVLISDDTYQRQEQRVVVARSRLNFFFFSIMENLSIFCRNIRNSPFHGRLLPLFNVSISTLLCTALLPALCTLQLCCRCSIAIFTTAADLNAVCYFWRKRKVRGLVERCRKLDGGLNTFIYIFSFFFAQIRFFNNIVRRFSKSGDFYIVSPVIFLLSRLPVKG